MSKGAYRQGIDITSTSAPWKLGDYIYQSDLYTETRERSRIEVDTQDDIFKVMENIDACSSNDESDGEGV